MTFLRTAAIKDFLETKSANLMSKRNISANHAHRCCRYLLQLVTTINNLIYLSNRFEYHILFKEIIQK